jgi:hypothetical protein
VNQVMQTLADWVCMVRSNVRFRKLSISTASLAEKAKEFHTQFLQSEIEAAKAAISTAGDHSVESMTATLSTLQSSITEKQARFGEHDRIRGFIDRFAFRHQVVFTTLSGEAAGLFLL